MIMIAQNRLLAVEGVFMLFAALTGNARAEVLNVASNGFEVRETVHVAASADKA
jgi:hypothetical protein